jgi:uncharacterized membrane protein
MSNLVVITFEDTEQAGKLRHTLKQLESGGRISLDDSAVVVKDEQGKVHIRDETDRGVAIGTIGGSMLGLLIGGVFFPIAGLVLGAAGGALVGSTLDKGIQKKFVKEVSEALQPGTSALFLIVREADPTYALAALRPYQGTIYHTSLDPEAEAELRRLLSQRQA